MLAFGSLLLTKINVQMKGSAKLEFFRTRFCHITAKLCRFTYQTVMACRKLSSFVNLRLLLL